ncbi:MAG: ABC transporter permease [Selenomonadaceae bacterium]|nr:ABC transporter permease [Selenomonadaceae bacterium]
MGTLQNMIQRDKNLARLLLVFVVTFAICVALKGSLFLSVSNFQSMGKQFPEFGLLAIAMAFTLFTAGIDLSVVAVANLCAVLMAKFLVANAAGADGGSVASLILIACVMALIIGMLCGALNGLLIGVVGITPILATLGTQALFMGCAIVLTNGSTLGGLPPQLSASMNSNVAGIPVTILIFVVFAAIAAFIMSQTTLGYKLRMLGTSVKASTFTGFSNIKLYVYNYMLSGVLSAVAGIIMLGRFNSAKADYGASYLMEAILIAVLGGVDPYGGKGNMSGVIVAIVIVQMVSSWLNMYEGISNFYRQIIWGALLIFVLIYNYVINEREKKKAMKG